MKTTNVLYLLPLLALSGCVLMDGLSPLQDGKSVKVSVIKPADVDILPMEVIYRSEKCRDDIFTQEFEITTRPGYHLLTVPFKPEAGADTVSNSIALNGGGWCEWKLSNIRFQFEFSDATRFGKNVRGMPNDIVFVFDKHSPPRSNGRYEDISGRAILKKDYYALIDKEYDTNMQDVVYPSGQPLLTYRAHNIDSILFIPAVHSNVVVKSFSPNDPNNPNYSKMPTWPDDPTRKRGGHTIIYPNGEMIIDLYRPDSEKLKYDFVKQRAH